MTLTEKISKLLELKVQAEKVEEAYDAQRQIVQQELDQAGLSTVEQDGYSISRTEDQVVRSLDKDLLLSELSNQGLAPDLIEKIFEASFEESNRKGYLRVTRL